MVELECKAFHILLLLLIVALTLADGGKRTRAESGQHHKKGHTVDIVVNKVG
jgi:hypothetical protein